MSTPTSNFPMRFYIEEAKFHKNHLVLFIQLWSNQILGKDKLIKELFDSCGDMWATQFVRLLHRTRSLEGIYIFHTSLTRRLGQQLRMF